VELNLNLTPTSRRRPTPALSIPSLQQQRPRNIETEKRLRALKTGSLKINGLEYQTNVNDLEYLSELGNGTSGHVVKMRHKPSGAIIAVKASEIPFFAQLDPYQNLSISSYYCSKCDEREMTRRPKESPWISM
jgi:hypothetical protein